MQTKLINKIAENVRNYQGKNGTTYIHTVSLKDPIDVEGASVVDFEYHALTATCEKFVAGQEATFDVEKRVNGQYTNYKIKPIQVQKPAFAGAAPFAKKYESKNQEVITALSCASTSANFYQQRQATEEQVIVLADKLYNWAMSKSK
jgi:hypothetical protein